jgi:hypothetical protein
MIYFLRACCTVLKVRKVRTTSSPTCIDALICAVFPCSIFSGARSGDVGFTQSVGPAGVYGATMA